MSPFVRAVLGANALLDAWLALDLPGSRANVGGSFPGLSADGVRTLEASLAAYALIRGYAALDFSPGARRAAQLSYVAEMLLPVLLKQYFNKKALANVVALPAVLIVAIELAGRAASRLAKDAHAVSTPAALRALYKPPSQLVLKKVAKSLDAKSTAFISNSPFFILGTVGPRGVHATPRGDPLGAVQVLSPTTIGFGDRRGNNRLDGLRDIVDDPHVALLFLIPGVTETLRINGLARITTDPALRARFECEGKQPTTVVVVHISEVFMQCAKALMRSKLWGERKRPEDVPTMGEMIEEHMNGEVKAVDVDKMITPESMRETMY
ncbi:hypothetical protein DFJ74DRAFT_775029 [Hyaloraphidium curvatum]|nr:hypothetical protein DFJ74DRAFT_775029 [Hyaloraphidium curvatum]